MVSAQCEPPETATPELDDELTCVDEDWTVDELVDEVEFDAAEVELVAAVDEVAPGIV
jgi:hypothetical protein